MHDLGNHGGEKSVSVASSSEIGMSAYCADFGEPGEAKPLSRHGYQRSVTRGYRSRHQARWYGEGRGRARLAWSAPASPVRQPRSISGRRGSTAQETGRRRPSGTFLHSLAWTNQRAGQAGRRETGPRRLRRVIPPAIGIRPVIDPASLQKELRLSESASPGSCLGPGMPARLRGRARLDCRAGGRSMGWQLP